MKLNATRSAAVAAILSAVAALSACSTNEVIDNTTDVAAGATKIVAKGVVGAGELAYEGGKMLVGADD